MTQPANLRSVFCKARTRFVSNFRAGHPHGLIPLTEEIDDVADARNRYPHRDPQ
jgi:hypothetical protein